MSAADEEEYQFRDDAPQVIICAGKRALARAQELKLQHPQPELAHVVSPGTFQRPADGLRERLRLLMAASTRLHAPRVLLLAEPRAPLALPAGAARQLVRVALGIGAVEDAPGAWLAGYPLPQHYRGDDRDLEALLASRRPIPLPATAGALGRWPLPYTARRVLLVGVQPSERWPAKLPPWPFISALRSGCSWWLAEQLELSGVPESQLCWINSRTRDGAAQPEDVSDALRAAGFSAVVALGRTATRWCVARKLAPTVREAPHPQFWKRFQRGNEYPLVPLLKELL